jgi:hypothetical protein
VIPIGFLWKDGRLFVCTAPSAPKVAALTVTIDTGNTSDTAKQLLIRGTAAIEIIDGVAPEYIEAVGKGLSGTDIEEFEAQVQAIFEQQARPRSLQSGRGSMTSAPGSFRRSFAGWPKGIEAETLLNRRSWTRSDRAAFSSSGMLARRPWS